MDKVKDETCFFDKVPDEVLEKILSYVPIKDNCFLVNKKFHKESIYATRNRCRLLLNDDNVRLLEALNDYVLTNYKCFRSRKSSQS